MNSVALFCAVVVGGGFFAPDFWGVSSEKAPSYQVQMELVELEGRREHITTVPNIIVAEGQTVRVKCESKSGNSGPGCPWRLIRCDEENCAFERHSTPNQPKGSTTWRTSLTSVAPDQVFLILAFQTSLKERSYRDRLVGRTNDHVFTMSFQTNQTYYFVLDHDEQGNGTAQVALRIREINPIQAASDHEESSENPKPGILPFHYEPY